MATIEGTYSTFQMWKSLEEQLFTMTKENEIHLNEAILSLKKGSLSLDDYLKKLKSFCDQLEAMKKPVDDLTKVFHVARGLGPKYQGFKTAMLTKAPYPTYNEFFLALKVHEVMVNTDIEEEKSSQPNHNQAFYAQRGRGRGRGRHFSSRGRGFPQGKPTNSHTASYTSPQKHNPPHGTPTGPGLTNSPFHNTERITCQICGKGNHTTLECWNRFDRHFFQSEDVPKALAALNLNEGNDPLLYADSGVTSHILNDPSKILTYQPYKGHEKIFVGNGNQLHISHIGQGKLTNGYNDLKLKSVLIVPDMKKNLLSISKLTQDNDCIITFLADKFVIKNKQGQILCKGERKGGLYALDEHTQRHQALLAVAAQNRIDVSLWHKRMGHVTDASLKTLSEQSY